MSKKVVRNAPPKLKCSQALVVAENFGLGSINFCLEPCPLEAPLFHVLRLLENSDLPEVFVFTAAQELVARVLKLKTRRWRCRVRLIFSENCSSVGDVLREVHRMGIIHNDFVLAAGNLISEINLRQYIFQFEERADRGHVIAMKLFVSEEQSTPNNLRERNLVVIEKGSNVLRHFERVNSDETVTLREHGQFSFKPTSLPVLIHFDLEDSGLTLCSLDVFNVYSEHFEFANEQDDFLRDVTSSELAEEQVVAAVIPKNVFHVRVNTSYKLLRTALLQVKRCFSGFGIDQTLFACNLRANQTICRTATLIDRRGFGFNVLIGENASLGCKVVLRNSFVGENCVIGDECSISNSFIGAGVCVPAGTCLESVCWLGAEEPVIRTLHKDSLSARRGSMFYGEEVEERRILHSDNTVSREEQFCFREIGKSLERCAVRAGLVTLWGPSPVGDLDEREDGEQCSEEEEEQEPNFIDGRVRETLARLSVDLSNINAVRLNLVNIRLAENRTFSDMIQIVGHEILTKVASEPTQRVRVVTMEQLLPLLDPFVADEDDQSTLVSLAEKFCRANPNIKLSFLLQLFFRIEIIDAATMHSWRKKATASPDETRSEALDQLSQFFDWLGDEEEV